MTGRVEVEAAPVLAAFDRLAHSAADISDPTRTVLAIGLDEARAGAPVRTGELVGSLAIDVTPTGGELAASRAACASFRTAARATSTAQPVHGARRRRDGPRDRTDLRPLAGRRRRPGREVARRIPP